MRKKPDAVTRAILVYLAALAVIFGALGAAIVTVSKAVGAEWPAIMEVQTIVCNSQAQVEQIVEETKRGDVDAGRAVYMKYNAMRGEDGQPVCGIGQVMAIIKEEVSVYHGVKIGTVNATAYVISFTTPQEEGKVYYMLILRAAKENGV